MLRLADESILSVHRGFIVNLRISSMTAFAAYPDSVMDILLEVRDYLLMDLLVTLDAGSD